MKTKIPLFLLAAILVVAGCTTLYQSVVTITAVVDQAMKDWATLSVSGVTGADLDTKVKAAYDKYRQAAAVTQTALQAYKAGGSQTDYQNALVAVRAAAQAILDLIGPLVSQAEGQTLQTNLNKAKTL